MIHHSFIPLSSLGLIFMPLGVITAAPIDSAASGNWNATGTWSGGVVPQTGVADDANILSGHTVIYTNTAPFAGLNGSADFGAGNGNSINVDGGVLSQSEGGWWVRIGHKDAGTLNINEGRFHITDATGGGTNLQVGVETNGNGTINVGNDSGDEGSAVLNLRDRVDGSANVGAFHMNLAANDGTVGHVTINSDGVLEGDQKTWNAGNPVLDPHIRIGQSSSDLQSVLTVNASGQFNARGNVEVGAAGGAKGLLHLNGFDARMDMSDGQFTVGYSGTGLMTVENDAVFARTNTTDARSDIYVGRFNSGNGTITIASGGQFRREGGGNVGDMRIGFDATGVLNVETDGIYHNASGNWDWIGENSSGNGTVNVNGGTYEITSGSNLIIGLNGTGAFHQTSGLTNVNAIRAGAFSGTGSITIDAGTFNVRSFVFLGGESTTSNGTGSGTITQNGGETLIADTLSVGLAANHIGTYNLNGGTAKHTTSSDLSVGESGTGTMIIAPGASFQDTAPGQFYVGRNDGSSGTLIVNGTLTKSGSANAIRVGNGNSLVGDNTNATGLLGGTGSISSGSGVRIGTRGTLTAGLATTVGDLDITGNLSFSSGGKLSANIAGATADRVNVTGNLDVVADAFAFDVLSAPTAATYVIATYTGTFGGTLSSTTVPAGYELKHDTAAKEIQLVKSGYETWAAVIPDEADRDRTDDPDGDGFTNLQEYLFGTSPIANTGTLTPTTSSASDLTIRWFQRNSGATYSLEESTTLQANSWVPSVTPVVDLDTPAPADYSSWMATVPYSSAAKFFHVKGAE